MSSPIKCLICTAVIPNPGMITLELIDLATLKRVAAFPNVNFKDGEELHFCQECVDHCVQARKWSEEMLKDQATREFLHQNVAAAFVRARVELDKSTDTPDFQG